MLAPLARLPLVRGLPWLLVFLGSACAGRTVSRTVEPVAKTEPSELSALNARAEQGAVTERVHGMEVHDPFRALEQDSELTRAWISEQNARTERALSALRRPEAERRLGELLSIGFLEGTAIAGDRIFLARREGDRDQAALYLYERGALGTQPIVDPASWGPKASLDWFYASPKGRYVAFGISDNGDERSVLRVYDLSAGALLPGTITQTKWTNLAWLKDESGFYYTRYPRAGERGYDPSAPEAYFSRLFFHALGTSDSSDRLVFETEERTAIHAPAVSDDDRYVVINTFLGWTASDVRLFDRGKVGSQRTIAPDGKHPLVTVVVGRDKLTRGTVHRGLLYLLTNEGAPRQRVVAVEPERASDLSAWRDVIPQGSGKIEDLVLLKQHLAVHVIDAMCSRLRVLDLDTSTLREVELPTRGSLEGLSGDASGSGIAFSFSSYFLPPSLMRFDAGQSAARMLYQVAHDLDASAYEVSQASVRSADGTAVNVFYVHKKGIANDRSHPVLVYGYGGFDVSLLPEFTRSALYFIERGGIYAVANLRGGGELGEDWHRAGMFENKPRVFEDFEAVVRWFSESGLSRPERIAVTGGSNGGLLVAALVTRAPKALRAAAAYVGLYDMLRYHLFPPAELWTAEYGDPREPDAAKYLHGYSPYHRVQDGSEYPAVLIETADHDTRVSWAHSTKFAARLQKAQRGPHPIYFHMEREQGHGAGTGLRDLIARYARMYAFLEHELGMR